MNSIRPPLWAWIIAIVNIGALLWIAHARAQDVATVEPLDVPAVTLPITGEILALDAGQRAPHEGMLVLDVDLVAWRQAIERLTYELAATRALDGRVCDLRVHQETARTLAATDRLELHEQLWTARAAELAEQLTESRRHEGPEWYEAPLLWVVVGAVLGGAVVGIVAGAVR